MLKQLNLASLAEIDNGRFAVVFQEMLRRIEADCRDRPGVEKARTITIKVSVTPVLAEDSKDLSSCQTTVDFEESLPTRKSKVYIMDALPRGGLAYNEIDPSDARVPTLPFATQPQKEIATNVG